MKLFPYFSILAVILVNFLYAKPVQFGPTTDAERFSGKAWINQVTSGIYDYLPKAARQAPQGPPKTGVDEVYPPNALVSLDNKKGSSWDIINISLNQEAEIYLSRLDFPGTKVYLNGKEFPHTTEGELGRISLRLPAGDSQLYINLTNTPIRTIGNFITLTTLLMLGLISIWSFKPIRLKL